MSKFAGSWEVKIAFRDGPSRVLRFDAEASGKGSFRLLEPKPNLGSELTTESAGQWSEGEKKTLKISGPVTFPLGNIGREQGRLVLEGSLGADGVLSGKAEFFPLNEGSTSGPQPTKSGTFQATRQSR